MGVLRVDRDALWRRLLPHGAGDTAAGVDRRVLLQRAGYWLRADVAPAFWRFFSGFGERVRRASAANARPGGRRALALLCAEQLSLALQFAEDALACCVELASLLGDARESERMVDELRATFRCIVFEDFTLKEKFQEVLVIFFSMSFQKFRGKEKFQALASQPVRELLAQLEWMGIAEPALLRVVHSQVRQVIHATCGDEFSEKYLGRVEAWACVELLPWLDDLFQATAASGAQSTQSWREVISQHVLQEFGSLRITQLFEIIKDYPDSIPALDDLRGCLERTHQHGELVHEFRGALLSRLLQPGANTSEILDIYVSTIKAFRILDPKGVLLETLSEPVKEYLRNRKDTVRCIVVSLTDDQNGDLFEELRRNNMRLIQHDDDSDDDEDASPDDWEPDPIEADPTKTTRSRSSDDILRILVNIYGSKELFVNEYRMMLADKLLQNLDYNTDRDVQTLELLKLRFGEDSLQQCEIMVRDIDDSKRINLNIRSTLEKQQQRSAGDVGAEKRARLPPPPVDATIVSQQFWPPFQGDDFALHPSVAGDVERYMKAYEVLRNPRSLAWNPSLGSVQHVSVWLNHGLLAFSPDRKSLVASSSFPDSQYDGDGDGLMDEVETAVSSDAQEAEELRMLETYIVGMLSNFGSLPIQRIHNMLSTFSRSGAQPYDKTISGLSVILGKLVDQGKLEVVGGQYQRAK
ncbi:hypothetical protein PybrP1_006910 [[Pythium] brassicae (nom. inval.)]|nr:hypothetical protein PybrP1_006910 [[Pythium] brassicae (nom. inval.)]